MYYVQNIFWLNICQANIEILKINLLIAALFAMLKLRLMATKEQYNI